MARNWPRGAQQSPARQRECYWFDSAPALPSFSNLKFCLLGLCWEANASGLANLCQETGRVLRVARLFVCSWKMFVGLSAPRKASHLHAVSKLL